MFVNEQQIKTFSQDIGLLTKEQIKTAEQESAKSGKSFEETILNQQIISAEDLAKLKAYILGIPFVSLENETIPTAILQLIPEPIAKKHNIISFRKRGEELEVAMIDPKDLGTIEFIKKKTNLRILPRLTNEASIKAILKQYQKSLETEFGEIIKEEVKGLTIKREEETKGEQEELEKLAEDLPVIKIVDTLIKHAILQSASDIHIEPTEKEVVIRYRIDGILHDAMILPKQIQTGVTARIKVLSNLKLDEHRLPQDGRFKVETDEYKVSFRVSILPVYDGEKIVMRLLRETTHAAPLESLGLHNEALERVYRAIKKPIGMFLVTGPTGSGKTTTLYSVMDILNTPKVNISTVEDPIEYRMPRINQTQIRSEIGLSFANGLRALLRQDPNILMVGEIRDNETASLAINAALTGHMVLSTLHTNNAAGAIPRLFDMKVEPFLIASTLNAVLAQRLVRTLCPNKERYRLTKDEIKILEKEIDLKKILDILKNHKIVSEKADWPDIDFYKAKPDKDCPDGYKGRMGIYEIMEISETLKELIIKQASHQEIEKYAIKEGMVTMLEDGFIKAVQGYTSLEEVLRVTRE